MNTLTSFVLGVVLMLVRLLAVALIGGLLIRWSVARKRSVYRVEVAPSQLRREYRGALKLVLFDGVVFMLVHHFAPIRFAPSTAGSALLSLIAIFSWFEVSYFALHRALHGTWLYWIHRRHHEAMVCHPVTGLVFSGAERLLQTVLGLGGVALLSRVLPLSQVALEGYLVLSYVLNGVGHANVELTPVGWTRRAIGAFFITTSFHALHHARFVGHYGLYTTVMDRLCGTVFADAEAVHDAAARGEGLQSLGERADAELLRPQPGRHVAVL